MERGFFHLLSLFGSLPQSADCLSQGFAGLAKQGKTSTGWFFGVKLHLVIHDRGELLNVLLTPGNVNDRKPVPKPLRKLFGKVFGEKGYISRPLYEWLRQTFDVQLVTKLKFNAKN